MKNTKLKIGKLSGRGGTLVPTLNPPWVGVFILARAQPD